MVLLFFSLSFPVLSDPVCGGACHARIATCDQNVKKKKEKKSDKRQVRRPLEASVNWVRCCVEKLRRPDSRKQADDANLK